jgi:hypothetical protein
MLQLQLAGGRHFLMENSLSSAAWKLDAMICFLQDPRVRSVVVDMCRFGLLQKQRCKRIESPPSLFPPARR